MLVVTVTSPLDIKYVAGLFDGEGSVGIYKDKNRRYTLHITISNSYKAVLTLIKEQFGGFITRHNSQPRNKTGHIWNIKSKKAEKFMRLIIGHTIIKRQQLEIALKFRETFDNENRPCLHRPLKDETVALRDYYMLRVKELKGRRK